MPAPANNKYHLVWNDEELDTLCNDFLDWAENEKDIHLAGFARRHKYVPSWVNRMAERHPKFAETLQEVQELLSRKIVNTSFYDKTANAYAGLRYLWQYDRKYREFLEWEAMISKEQPIKEENRGAFNDWLKQQKESKD